MTIVRNGIAIPTGTIILPVDPKQKKLVNAIQKAKRNQALFTGQKVQHNFWPFDDLPDWEDVKTYGETLLAQVDPVTAPARTAALLAANEVRKTTEQATGQKLSSQEVAALKDSLVTGTNEVVGKSVQEHVVEPIANFFSWVKWILIAVIITGAIVVLSKAKQLV